MNIAVVLYTRTESLKLRGRYLGCHPEEG